MFDRTYSRIRINNHNHCFQFLLGITLIPREIEDNYGYAKFEGVSKAYYGLCENGEWEKLYKSLFMVQLMIIALQNLEMCLK